MKVSGPGPPGPGPGGRFLSQKSPPAPPPRNNWGPCGGAYRGLGSQHIFYLFLIIFLFILLLLIVCAIHHLLYLFCSRCELVPCSRLCCPRCTARSSLVGLRFETATVCWTRTRPGAGGPGPGPGGRPGRPGGPAGPAPGRGAPGGPRRDPGSGPGYLKFYNEVHYKMLNK